MALIELKEVTKEYNKNVILQDVNLEINEGDIIGIIGQSGSGKTTLLNLIAGFIEPSRGDIFYISKMDGQPKSLAKNIHKLKRHMGFNAQHTSFYPKLTVKENLLHFGQMYGLKKSTLIENAKSLLQITGLYDHRDKLAAQLSGGMQKRLDISCSLIHKPKILFLDEPTSDLDPVMQREVIALIQEVNTQGVTVVMASHHLESLEKICTKIAIVHEKEVHSYGEIEEIRKPFLKDYININVKAGKDTERIIAMVKKMPITKIIDKGDQLVIFPKDADKTLAQLMVMIKQENLYLHDIDLRKPTLDEVFVQITKKR